jgi:steroid 5-alpha reductase family enzyme
MNLATLIVPISICAAVAAACWILSLATKEYSWVDRIWSIVPIVYLGWFAHAAGGGDARLNLMAFLVAAWGARLTFNFARKGGYASGGEDYRWAELRRRMEPLTFQVFNVVFICAVQNALLLAIALPAWIAFQHTGTPLRPLDVIAAALVFVFLTGETIADEQQWRFQSDKKRREARGERVVPGFVTTGLFRYSRHPNFFCEQAIWWSLYLFGVAAGGGWINVSLIGPVALTLLFHGSTNFTEELSAKRYPAYVEYQKRTSRLLPWWPTSGGA